MTPRTHAGTSPPDPGTSSSGAPRVMLVTRHFWPHTAGRHEHAAAAWALAQSWVAGGLSVQVATPRYGADWPPQLHFSGLVVHRVAAAPHGPWATSRYLRYLSGWLAEQAAGLDAIVCDTLREDVVPVASLTRRPLLKAAIAAGWGSDSDLVWCRKARGGSKAIQAAATLDAIVTEDATTDRALLSHQISASRLVRIPRGFQRTPRRSSQARVAARRNLAVANSDLATAADDRVLVWCGAMRGRPDATNGLGQILAAARRLVNQLPRLKIWLIGDGPLRDWLHTELKAEGIRAAVSIPGSFAELTDVWDAADVVLQTDPDSWRETIPAAIQQGLPLVATSTELARLRLGLAADDPLLRCIAWFDEGKWPTLVAAVTTVLVDLPAANQSAATLAQSLSRQRPVGTALDQWRKLFHSTASASAATGS